MNTMRTACFLVALAAATPAFAQAPLSLSLDEALKRGVEHAPRLAEARAREAAANATVASRQAARAPVVTASSSYMRTNHIDELAFPQAGGGTKVLFPDVPNNYQARADVSIPLYTSGRVVALVDAARGDLRAVEADAKVTEQDLRLQIAAAYWTLVMARESVLVLEEAQRRTDAYVGDVRSRLDAGVAAPNDLLSAQSQRARQSVQVIQARNAAALAEADLARLIGASPGQSIVTTSAVDQQPPTATGLSAQSVDALVTRATSGRAERKAFQEREGALAATANAALAALRPTIAGFAGVQPARPNQMFVPRVDAWKTSWTAGVSVNWQIFDGGKAHADQAAAVAQADAVHKRLEDFDSIVALEVRQRWLDLESGRAALAASGEAVQAAAEAHRVVQERFRAGVATSTDVLDALLALREAELERTRLQATLRLGEARLLRAIGAL